MSKPLADLLNRPEGRTLDFKRQEAAGKNIVKTLVAFANTAGGILVLGADDDGTAIGLSSPKTQEERLANLVSNNVEPPLDVDLELAAASGKELLVITVHRLPGPFYVRADGPEDGVYTRVGSTNRKASAEKRAELRRVALAKSFDERPCLGATLDDLDMSAIDQAFRPVGRVPDGGALVSLGIVTDAGQARVPTNAGIILFGTAPALQRWFPDAVFRCARFLGTKKVDFLDQFDPGGSVLSDLDGVEKFVRRNTRTAARIESWRRQDVPEYSTIHLREVLANAVAHTDYSQRGMNLRVAVFDDRMEVENPGGWPIGFSEEDFKAGISRPRNPAIASILRELDLIEKWGTGYRRISEASENSGYPVPVWLEIGPVLRTVLFPHPDVTDRAAQPIYSATGNGTVNGIEAETVKSDQDSINRRQQWMLMRLVEGNVVAAEDVMTQFGVSERTARRDIAGLRNCGLVGFEGPPKTGRYVLIHGGSGNRKP